MRNAVIKVEETTRQRTWISAGFRVANGWWAFCVVVFTTKLLLLWLDPTPKLFMGDSGAYIWTALTGWIPSDRSYLYGYLVRWLAVWPHSFLPLLTAQALASGVTAIVFARICCRFFGVSNRLSFLFGFLCALDPSQLVWERYVMTETFSLLVYVLVLYRSLLYVRDRRLWELAVVQALSVVLIAFRISYLLVVQVCTVLLPIIAFARCASPAFRNQSEARSSVTNLFSTGFEHVVVSVALMIVMHDAYKHVNGSFAKREPAYLYDAGAHLAAVWAPALQPSDATDPRFRDLIANGDQFKIDNLRQRNAQQFGGGFLMDRWSKMEKDPSKRDRVARETAINALRRRPLEIVELTLKTYLGYLGIRSIKWYARKDLGYGKLTDDQVNLLAEKFRFTTLKPLPAQPLSLVQRYFLRAWPYYFIVIISPLTCAFATWLGRDRALAFLLFVHVSILMMVVTALSPQPSIRYLQPVSILTLLSLAICADWLTRRARPAAMQSARTTG